MTQVLFIDRYSPKQKEDFHYGADIIALESGFNEVLISSRGNHNLRSDSWHIYTLQELETLQNLYNIRYAIFFIVLGADLYGKGIMIKT